ncbi:diguanylate cyclase [Halioglobus maricola]|uniref:diguanylate cyclase n=1 Tax=Halioglobus maricola TaxID=2601894 RepID=A0A5P9NFS5_9GAMM|nr:diguanylate cyclase [Halioglobus maricola]QFU74640.1 diguanylate cyclase [Halioglobus maricola]
MPKVRALPSYASTLLLRCLAILLFAGQGAVVHANDSIAALVDENMLRDGLSLKGEWRFQPGDDLAWANPALDDSSWQIRRVPGRWSREGYPEHRHMGWYRLTLQLQPQIIDTEHVADLAVRLGNILSAYEVFAGGELVGKIGRLPPLEEVLYDRQRVFSIPQTAIDEQGRLVLALRVWGGPNGMVNAWGAGPASGNFELGHHSPLILEGVVGELPGLIFCALIFAFGCYHLYIYTLNRGLRTYLWFGLTSLNIALYGLMLTQWKFFWDVPFVTLKKIEFGAIYFFPALGIQLVWSILKLPISPALRVLQGAFILLSMAVVSVPGHEIHYKTLTFEQTLALGLMAYAAYVILRETRAGSPHARGVAAGTLIFLATCLNDIAIDLFQLDTLRLAPLGFVAILLSMAISMARNYTSMHSKLEEQVAQRTAQLREANQKLMKAASIDHLTGLLNRRGFTEEVALEISRAVRTGKSFSLVLADVDHFKQFNDKHGHACGDHVLRRVGVLLGERTRDVDRVARWGGEEFMLMLPETDSEGAAVLAEKLRETIAENVFEFGGQRLSLTMTFGVAEHRQGETLETCVARADTALYHGKERGRNKVMIGNIKGLTLVG